MNVLCCVHGLGSEWWKSMMLRAPLQQSAACSCASMPVEVTEALRVQLLGHTCSQHSHLDDLHFVILQATTRIWKTKGPVRKKNRRLHGLITHNPQKYTAL